mgnify:CR=1 FL=1
MKKGLIVLAFLFSLNVIYAQVFDVAKIKNAGADDKRLNLVILSEGYQANEFEKFETDAQNFVNSMFSQSPFKEYSNYFNVHIIKVPSNESGADHPGTGTDVTEPDHPTQMVDTYFNATFDSFGFHRLLFYEIDGNHSNNTEAKINNVLAANFPTNDQAMILVNSPYYGGSGGKYPMASTHFWGADIAIHELGHSLFSLIDEYYPIDDVLAVEGINMTQEIDPNLVRWKNWMNTNGVGIYQHEDNNGVLRDWYRPHQTCKMRRIDWPFCSVCKEGIVKKVHDLISPIASYSPVSNSISNPSYPLSFKLDLIKTIPNTLKSTWSLNASNFTNDVDEVTIVQNDLIEGVNTLTTVVYDATALVNIDNYSTTQARTITWTIDNSTLGIATIASETNSLSISVFPNPSHSVINFNIESENDTNLKVDILSIDGKKIKSIPLSNYEIQQVDISFLSNGLYLANIYANGALVASKKLVKK